MSLTDTKARYSRVFASHTRAKRERERERERNRQTDRQTERRGMGGGGVRDGEVKEPGGGGGEGGRADDKADK